MKEIPNTKLLVSLNHQSKESANMKIFDVSKSWRVKEIYTFEEVFGGDIDLFPLYFLATSSFMISIFLSV